ncbi:carboxypeptidase-like regulatory domain-containing protein [Chitinophaga oryzae]|uniref:Carboxypeptidase-like regulatory domain-containing protein n=1 Tax=Chitinophaga oryzae TaxID=2725414 RepID=A0ABX6LKE1_9BACT|nr:carboxypeptidase-like regulatory domain-containing protein [Chitinophaga oryzae]QJB40611.1 carboxypeptidase-like regulatory domain-containing protein [Chitinophaga oryzae]
MRKISLIVSIPHPCQQSWENMIPAAGGRFCDSCRKTVIDFTGLTDSEVLALLSNTSQQYCGRFRQSQLDRKIRPEPQAASLLPVAVLGALLAAGVPATMAAAADHPVHQADTTMLRTISGKVTLEGGATMPGALVAIKGSNTGAVADANGHYHLNIPAWEQKITLVFSFIGCTTAEVPVTSQQTVDVVLKEIDTQLLGEVVVVGAIQKRTPWQRIKYKWRRLWHR